MYGTLACCDEGLMEAVFHDQVELQLSLDWSLCRAELSHEIIFPKRPSVKDYASVADGRGNGPTDAELKTKLREEEKNIAEADNMLILEP